MNAATRRCLWCLEEPPEAPDNRAAPCACCGPDDAPRSCEHRTKQTLDDLFRAGVRLVRRDPWSEGSYVELVEVGGFMAPFGLIHSPLEWADAPDDVRATPQRIRLWMTPRGGWEPYHGRTA